MMNSLPKDSTPFSSPQPCLTSISLGNTRYKSPSLRSSVTNSTRTSKISQHSPKVREEDFYKGKGELMNNLVEHNIFLKRELNLQEREGERMRNKNMDKLELMEKDVVNFERSKNELLGKIDKAIKDTQNLDEERINLLELLSDKNDKIGEVLKQLLHTETESKAKEKAQKKEYANLNELQQKYLNMLEDREEAMNKLTSEIKRLEHDIIGYDEEIRRIQEEIERKTIRTFELKAEINEGEVKSQTQDRDLRNYRIQETENDAEMGILSGQRIKLVAEREKVKGKIADLKEKTTLILRKLLEAQKHIEIKLNGNLKAFGTRVLFIVMKRMKQRKQQEVFERIDRKGCSNRCVIGAVAKLSSVTEGIQRRYALETLRGLHNRFLDYGKMSCLNEKMLKVKSERNLVFRAWLEWRQAFKLIGMRREDTINSLERMGRILREMEMRHKGEFFSAFQQVETKNKTKSMILHSLIMHKEHKEYQRAIRKWKTCMRVNDLEETKAYFEDSLTNTRLLGYCWNRLKDNVTRKKNAKFELIKRSFEKWTQEYNHRRLMAGCEIQAEEMFQAQNRKLVSNVFVEWKQILLETKNATVEAKGYQKAEELETNRTLVSNLERTSDAKAKNALFRMMNIALQNQLQISLHRWKANAKTRSNQMIHAFDSLNRIWEKSTRQNFKKWKLAATYARYHSTAKEHQGVVLDFHELTHMLNEAQEVEKNQENINTERNLFMLERISQRYKKNKIYAHFRRFYNNTRKLNTSETAIHKGFFTLHRVFLKVHRRSFVSSVKEFVENKKLGSLLRIFEEKRDQRLKAATFEAFSENSERRQDARHALKRQIQIRCNKLISRRFYTWLSHSKHHKNQEYKERHEDLTLMCETKTRELKEEVKANHANILEDELYERKAVSARNAHIWNLLFQNIYALKLRGLKRWNEKMLKIRAKRKATEKMVRWIKQCYYRTFLKRLILHGDKLQVAQNKEALEDGVNQRKELREKIEKEKKSFDAKNAEQKAQIGQLNNVKETWTKRLDHALETTALRVHVQKNQENSHEIIVKWKKMVEDEKKGWKVFGKFMSKKVWEIGFERIKANCEYGRMVDLQKKYLLRMIQGAEKSKIGSAFHLWRRVALARRRASLKNKHEIMSAELARVNNYNERILHSRTFDAQKRMERKMLKVYFEGWIQGKKFTKELETKKKRIMEKHEEEMRKSFFRQLWLVKTRKKTRKNIVENSRKKRGLNLLRVLFGFWKDEVWKMKTLANTVMRYKGVINAWHKGFAFEKLKRSYLKDKSDRNIVKNQAVVALVNKVDLIARLTAKQSFLQMKQFVKERIITRERLRQLFIRAARGKIAHIFRKWRTKGKCQQLVLTSQVDGELYEKKLAFTREKETLEEFIKKEGYKQEDVEHYQAKDEVRNYNLMQKAISRLMLNACGMSVMTKALHSWKEFVVQRKRFKRCAALVHSYRQKGDVMSAFNKWRNWASKVRDHEDELPKAEIMKRIIVYRNHGYMLEKNIQEIQSIGRELDETLQKQTVQMDIGRTMALRTMGNIEKIFRGIYFKDLKRFNKEYRQEMHAEESDMVTERILKLQKQIKGHELEYKELLEENGILRATSLEGLDITNAIQDLVKQRDELGAELHSKELTVQRLVDENRNLSTKLVAAQREAEELVKYAETFLSPKNNAEHNEIGPGDSRRNDFYSFGKIKTAETRYPVFKGDEQSEDF